jgi:hypothetical protein
LFYHINPSTKAYIDNGLGIAQSIDDMVDDSDMFMDHVKNLNISSMAEYINVNDGFDMATSILSIASAVLSAANAAQGAFFAVTGQLPSAAAAVAKAVFAAAVTVLSCITIFWQGFELTNDKNTINQLKEFQKDYNDVDVNT